MSNVPEESLTEREIIGEKITDVVNMLDELSGKMSVLSDTLEDFDDASLGRVREAVSQIALQVATPLMEWPRPFDKGD